MKIKIKPIFLLILAVPFVVLLLFWWAWSVNVEQSISSRVFNDIRHKVKINCGDQQNAAVILVFGQSNSSNEGNAPFSPRKNVINFNYMDGNCYLASDPLIGTSGMGGSFISRLGEVLIENNLFKKVILVPLSVGGSYIHDWAPEGKFHKRIHYALDQLNSRNLIETHILFHQGESDAAAKTAPQNYRNRFFSIVNSIRKENVKAPIFVATATLCGPKIHPEIRAAQQSLPDAALGIFAGPDTDTIGHDMRFDGCHMNAAGLDRHAELWLDVLARYEAGKKP